MLQNCGRHGTCPAHTVMRCSLPPQGLDRYVKKKQLDPLDTYVPLVLEARDVLAGLDGIMGEGRRGCEAPAGRGTGRICQHSAACKWVGPST